MSVLGNGARSVGSGARTVLEQPLKRAKRRLNRAQDDPAVLMGDTQQEDEAQLRSPATTLQA